MRLISHRSSWWASRSWTLGGLSRYLFSRLFGVLLALCIAVPVALACALAGAMILIGLSLKLLNTAVSFAIRGSRRMRSWGRHESRSGIDASAARRTTRTGGDDMGTQKPVVPSMDDMEIKRFSDERSMVVAKGLPVLIKLAMRPARSAPDGTRTKCVLLAPTMNDGDKINVPMPYAEPVIPNEMRPVEGGIAPVQPSGYTPEWRIESN